MSGFLGSSTGVASVWICITRLRSPFSSRKIGMVLSYDLDIFCPSRPGTMAVSSLICSSGTTKVSPKVLLKRMAMSRATSTCCFWSLPTGTTWAW